MVCVEVIDVGTYTTKSGDKYEGDWKDGGMSGNGNCDFRV